MSDTPRTDDFLSKNTSYMEKREFMQQLERELTETREELSEWRTLRSWGGTPQIVDDFIKGQQTRIHAAQDAEKQRDALAEALETVVEVARRNLDRPHPTIERVYTKALATLKGGQHE